MESKDYENYASLCAEHKIEPEPKIGLVPEEHPIKLILPEYRGVNILWDADKDTRIYHAVDELLDKYLINVYDITEFLEGIDCVGESKGSLTIYYTNNKAGFVAHNFLKDWKEFEPKGYDYWVVFHEFPKGEYEPEIYYVEEVEIPPRVISSGKRYEVCKRQKWKCNICGSRLKFHEDSEWDGNLCHIDHIHPYSDAENYSRGPENINESINLQALCEKCNWKKGKRKEVLNECRGSS
jgi:hypothetical protein